MYSYPASWASSPAVFPSFNKSRVLTSFLRERSSHLFITLLSFLWCIFSLCIHFKLPCFWALYQHHRTWVTSSPSCVQTELLHVGQFPHSKHKHPNIIPFFKLITVFDKYWFVLKSQTWSNPMFGLCLRSCSATSRWPLWQALKSGVAPS